MLLMTKTPLKDQIVVIRADLNTPMIDGGIQSDKRIQAFLPTLKYAIDSEARIIVLSHLGRPQAGKFDSQYSLKPIADYLSQCLNQKVRLCPQWPQQKADPQPGEVCLAENTRFLIGETENDPSLVHHMVNECDIFVMDAFATLHRNHASTLGIATQAPIACAGPGLITEINQIKRAMNEATAPVVTIIGGAKVSSKIHLLRSTLDFSDYLMVGGGIANTFIHEQGHQVGTSLVEHTCHELIQSLYRTAEEKSCQILTPQDVVVARDHTTCTVGLDAIASGDNICDIGPKTTAAYVDIIEQASTIIWNGPVGLFENEHFAAGTKAIGQAVAKNPCYSIAGGGNTIAALETFALDQDLSAISTGGGAFLSLLEGKKLPILDILS